MSDRTFLLQDWVTVRSSLSNPFIQDPKDWLDLTGFADASYWIDVTEITPPSAGASLQLLLETAPTCDDFVNTSAPTQSWFQPTTGPILLGTTAPFIFASATPFVVKSVRSASTVSLSRYLRWRIVPSTSGAWDITFRIRVVANRSGFFVPTDLAGCVLWLRADLGISLSGVNVSQWNDQSGSNNNAQSSSPHQPGYKVNPPINGQPTLFFNPAVAGNESYMNLSSSLASLTASHAFVVHRRANPGDSTPSATGFWSLGTSGLDTNMPWTDLHIYDDGGATSRYACGAPVVPLNTSQVYEVRNQAGSWKSLLNGILQYSSSTNTVGLTATPQIGGISPGFSGAVFYNGDWAEMLLFNRILSTGERARLISYFNFRYQLGAV